MYVVDQHKHFTQIAYRVLKFKSVLILWIQFACIKQINDLDAIVHDYLTKGSQKGRLIAFATYPKQIHRDICRC